MPKRRLSISISGDIMGKENFKSQYGQDRILLSLLGDRPPGFFVEMGAGDGIDISNSYYFEKELGWNGLLIEPNPDLYGRLIKNRNCLTSNRLCGKEEGIEVTFLVAGVVSGIVAPPLGYWVQKNIDNPKIKLRTYLLGNILKEFNCPTKMDFLSLDVEGQEVEILKTFPYENYSFDFICIEHNSCWDGPENREVIKGILLFNGYELVQETSIDDFYRGR